MKRSPKEDPEITAGRGRAKKMLDDLKATNPKAHALVIDPAPHVSGLCGRRGGKTYSAVLAALITGEAKPGAISIIVSLNKKQLKRLYWIDAPSGIGVVARRYGIVLTYNGTDLKWKHPNGSYGYLLGADDDQQLEVLRGLEADLYVIDECKSFDPLVLSKLIDEIIDPQRSSRNGRLILIGTPGNVLSGPFYEATCPHARDSNGDRYLVGLDDDYNPAPGKDDLGRTAAADLLWSAHHWDVRDNTAKPQQWEAALKKKKALNLSDDDPTWCREYRGIWALGGKEGGLVYRYSQDKGGGQVTWKPIVTVDNPTGLPAEGAPWRLVAGLDLGFVAPVALVLGAYSRVLGELRHVADYTETHLLPGQIADLLREVQHRFGPIETIYADAGNLGTTLVRTLDMQYGLPIKASDKHNKNDYVELVNDGFREGKIKIIEGTQLEKQLLTNVWKLTSDRPDAVVSAARAGKLKEDSAVDNDLTDAFLYMFRGSHHQYRTPVPVLAPKVGTPEWAEYRKAEELAAFRAKLNSSSDRFGSTPVISRIIEKGPSWKIPPQLR